MIGAASTTPPYGRRRHETSRARCQARPRAHLDSPFKVVASWGSSRAWRGRLARGATALEFGPQPVCSKGTLAMANTHDAIVVGGGHNGLIAGAYLSRAGARTV